MAVGWENFFHRQPGFCPCNHPGNGQSVYLDISLSDRCDKKKVIDCISCRGDIIYKRLLDSQFTILPYNNLNELSWQALGETAIVFISDISQAKDWVNVCHEYFLYRFAGFGGIIREGGIKALLYGNE